MSVQPQDVLDGSFITSHAGLPTCDKTKHGTPQIMSKTYQNMICIKPNNIRHPALYSKHAPSSTTAASTGIPTSRPASTCQVQNRCPYSESGNEYQADVDAFKNVCKCACGNMASAELFTGFKEVNLQAGVFKARRVKGMHRNKFAREN